MRKWFHWPKGLSARTSGSLPGDPARSWSLIFQRVRGSLVSQPNQPSRVLPSNRAVNPFGGWLSVWAGAGEAQRQAANAVAARTEGVRRMGAVLKRVGNQGGPSLT